MVSPGLTLVATTPAPQPTSVAGASRPRLGEILCARQLVGIETVSACLAMQQDMAAPLGALLQADVGLNEGDILSALQQQWGAGGLDLRARPPDPGLVLTVGLARCFEARALPWRHIGGATVIATSQPDAFEAVKPEFEALFGPVMLAIVSEQDLTNSLSRLFPRALNLRAEDRVIDSCRHWRGTEFLIWASATLATLAYLAAIAPATTFVAGLSFSLLILIAASALKGAALWAGLQSRHPGTTADSNVLPLLPQQVDRRLPVVSILVPLLREDQIAERLVRNLQQLDYPHALLDVCLVIEADDAVTRATLARTALPHWMRVLTVPDGDLRTKPRAMNYALDFCRGSIVGVYDAEDAPDADQISRVVARFAHAPPEVACLQGRLDFYNRRQNWMSRCFSIEYATWFGVVLPGIAKLGLPVPLGGTTLFFRASLLRQLGGWDAFNVTEDADLGLRLARHGYRTELIDTVTREEANCHGWAWVRQRSRWIKGYAMTYATHMQDPKRLWRDLGPRAFAGFQIMFLGSLLQALLAPLIWSCWAVALSLPHPLSPVLTETLGLTVIGVVVTSGLLNSTLSTVALYRSDQLGLLPCAVTMGLYHMLATLAAYKALSELMTRPFFWDKTQHGLSIDAGAPDTAAPAPA
ncbi:glycosyltransferase family 2 protein [Pseudoruegeria sp. SK021]|uniref:glycosyltransferase family 2 protein n=1 Tax=Pseudoruegeria sp. SK021 TaxID=1933035 RepID=UPI000A251A60|nr:glycosyltransferase family 2 protein [Pseudoruegeria sp. SK021]OSP56663.1 hypothetical protein BV911_01530 [Pseudoruegeria sp. SK021]